MKKWHLKAALQGAMSLFPFRQRMNYVFQKYVTRSLKENPTQFISRLGMAGAHLEFFTRLNGRLPQAVLELGTGWRPVVPIGLWLCGVDNLTSIDIQDLRRPEQILLTIQQFVSKDSDTLREKIPLLRDDRMASLRERAAVMTEGTSLQFLTDIGVKFIVGDARATSFAASSFDHIVSNTTFEHIPGPILSDILKEFRRIITPDGLMTHFIDMSDHYSHFDKSITPYNFLRYSSGQWRWFNNELQYQNRLRMSQYMALHREAGITVVEERTNGDATQLDTVPLASEFRGFSREDLAVSSGWIVARPAG